MGGSGGARPYLVVGRIGSGSMEAVSPMRKFASSLRASVEPGEGTSPASPPGGAALASVSSPARVLVVEDSPTQAEWLAQVLAREGYDVEVAGDGTSAIRRVKQDPPDLVILDMILPDMNGIDVLRFVKSGGEERFIPVILLSVQSDLESRVAGLRMGADDFIAKPFADPEILARAGAMLRIKSLQDQLRASKRELERLSVTDGLTGLYNHRFFQARVREEVLRSQRYGGPVSLVMLDLDHFKKVNDTFGHPFGDRVLRETAELIAGSIRDPDTCARYGGEEFAILLPKTHIQGAMAVSERFLTRMRTKVFLPSVSSEGAPVASSPLPPLEVRVTVSAGIASYPSQRVTEAELLVKAADEALYRAKKQGRDRICVWNGPENGAGETPEIV